MRWLIGASARKLRNATTTATVKLRLLYRSRSIAGSATRLEIHTNSAPKISSAATAPNVAPLVQPQVGPSLTTSSSAPTAATHSNAPDTSHERPGGGREGG